MLNKNVDTRKLEFYLKYSKRGFILLTVNADNERTILFQVISKYSAVKLYDLKKVNFHNTLFELERSSEVETVVYYNFDLSKEILYNTLEKVNLSRDLLLERGKIFVFIVPVYVEKIIQRDFPNLFSYFSLKESFVRNYEVFFEYIFPNSDYLITKQVQHESKRYYHSGNWNNMSKDENLNERMNYFIHAKISEKELYNLVVDVDSYLKQSTLEKANQDALYRNTIDLKMAKVLLKQKKYGEAFKRYKKIFYEIGYKFSDIYCDTLLGLGDSCYLMNEYEEALFYYNYMNSMLSIQKEYESKDTFNKYRIYIYARIALCYMKKNDYESAQTMMRSSVNLLMDKVPNLNYEYFEIIYNYFLMCFHINDCVEEWTSIDLKYLEYSAQNIVQRAMQLTIFSWYYGVVEGNLDKGLSMSQQALQIKREFFVENDLRIAESHYVNSVLYMMLGDNESASHCCERCENILKNFAEYNRQKEIIAELREELQV